MKKKWIALAILCGGLCLTTPTAALAKNTAVPDIAAQAEDTGEPDQSVPDDPGQEDPTPTPVDKSYQAKIAGKNAQGQQIVLDPLWEYNKASRAYRLVKSKDAQGKATYFTTKDGVLQLGRTAGYYYAFSARGDMLTAVKTVNNVRYSFTTQAKARKTTASVAPNGTTLGMAMRNCWVKTESRWYYFNNAGQQVKSKTGLQKIGGAYYYLSRSWVPSTDKWIKKSNGAYWYFGKDGKYKSSKIGHQKISGSYYYLKKNGVPFKNSFKTVKGKRYYYGKTGKRAQYTGWKTIKNKKYYFSSKHYTVVKPGWQQIGGKWYHFTQKGGMYAKRWATIGGKQYYFKANGQMAADWTKIGGTYYYFRSSGLLDRSTIAKRGGNYYFVTPQGTQGGNILDGVGVNAAMNNGTKLQTCFNYVVRNCRYVGGPVWPPNGWEPYHAYKMLKTRMGNCYDFAAAFCYLAKAVGYEGMICIRGQCASASGGLTPHAWCEFNGMVFDPEITYANGYYLFNVSYGSLPFAYVR